MAGSVTVFGSGNMGGAIGGLLADSERDVQQLGRDGGTTIEGDIVILAVPYESLEEIAERYRDQLAGKVVVDITNPVDFETFDSLKVPAHHSAAAELQEALPDARVVKAFNVNFAPTLAARQVGSATTTVLVAGDDDDAKAVVIELAREIGLEAVDAGSLARARELEALGFLQITLANAERISWSAGFGLASE